jgi:hypothetical protein
LPIDRFWDGVYFITPDTGIIVGRSSAEGRAYITFNGGTNWQAGYVTDFPLYGVTGLPNPNGSAWIYGYGSDIEILPYCTMLPIISNITGDNTPCENDTVTYSIFAQDVDQFSWLFPTGWVIQGSANNDTVRVKVGRNGGTISVTGSNSCGFSSPISISAGPILLPKLSNLTGELRPCEGLIIPYAVTGTDVDDFTWSFPGDWAIQGNANQATIQVLVGEQDGGISVSGANQCGETAALISDVKPELRPRMQSVDGLNAPCDGDLVQYSAIGEYYDEVIWTYPSSWEATGNVTEGIIVLWVSDEEGMVTATGANPCGMSATVELLVTPKAIPVVTVITNDNLLSLSQPGISFQWWYNGAPIANATESTYTATASGDYFAEITLENGCVTTTSPVNVIISSVGRNVDLLPLTIYPMPVSETLYLKGIENEFTYMITDVAGTLVRQGTTSATLLDVSALSEGVYILKMQQQGKTLASRFIVMR